MQSYTYNGWRILSFIPKNRAEDFFRLIQDGEYEILKILKENKRSNVVQFSYKGEDLVLKIPLEKNRNRWIRFTTLYRQGESYKCIKSLAKLNQLDIPTAQPFMAAEKRSFGMVVDSWLIYKYVPGHHCLDKENHYPKVTAALKSLHTKKYLHGDPQIRNFILGDDDIIHMIDAKLKPAYFSFYSKKSEWAYLSKSAPGIEQYIEVKDKFWYKVAKKADRYFRSFVIKKRRLLNGMKKFLPFNSV